MLQVSKITSKFQVTIPAAVRRVLGLKKGDAVAFEIEGNTVVVRRASALDRECAKAVEGTLSEWLSAEDEEAYREL
ncbi:MAG: type II toxin-antitoxin system PrlF family antitoxin [Sulfuricaulis sp.]|uniref:AbrB/MazE/SpoVT family DNA-binding domain-containing protein n=1 Tax=Sulfuricaulis sp. TaxID=2003553 RepID=UPI0025D547ED|nr:type II toxin-antitoxin system PrlF family antitoxin [Sulfuricaulis sp.]MCR4346332.1 type II toxin-antitoxin system PrlF family antitoxin [Sulfuricaulis sp.]